MKGETKRSGFGREKKKLGRTEQEPDSVKTRNKKRSSDAGRGENTRPRIDSLPDPYRPFYYCKKYPTLDRSSSSPKCKRGFQRVTVKS